MTHRTILAAVLATMAGYGAASGEAPVPQVPISLDGQTLDPGIQRMLKADADKAAAKPATADPGATAPGRAAVRRDAADRWISRTAAPPVMRSVEDRSIANGTGTIPVRIYRPVAAGPLPIIVYYHGGGWYLGGIAASDRSSRQLAHDAQAVVVSVDYRLSPETPYPGAWDDAERAYAWTVGEAARLGGASDRVCVGGDSAGGNMAIAVTNRRLQKGEPAPLCQVLYYPAVDNRNIDTMRATYKSSRLFGEGFNLNRSFTDYILPFVFPGQDLAQPEVSPLFAGSRRMPPTLIATAGFDPLRDSERAYAGKLAATGTSVYYREYPTLIHGFLQHTGVTPAAVRASRETAQIAGAMAREAIASNRTRIRHVRVSTQRQAEGGIGLDNLEERTPALSDEYGWAAGRGRRLMAGAAPFRGRYAAQPAECRREPARV